mmetsp:Transcript_11483/g.18486  ORF Transcript_11483/g.18486 Transcript_11483/m.18486 type:complete len:123 (+) Transcript_11483:1-369(+)
MYIGSPSGTKTKVAGKPDRNGLHVHHSAESLDLAENENNEEEARDAVTELRKVATVAMMNADILRKQLKLNDTMRSMSNGYGAYDEDEQGHDADDALHAMAQSMNMELVLSAPGNIEEQRTV